MEATEVTSDEKKGKSVSFDAMVKLFIINLKTGATVLYYPPHNAGLGAGLFL